MLDFKGREEHGYLRSLTEEFQNTLSKYIWSFLWNVVPAVNHAATHLAGRNIGPFIDRIEHLFDQPFLAPIDLHVALDLSAFLNVVPLLFQVNRGAGSVVYVMN